MSSPVLPLTACVAACVVTLAAAQAPESSQTQGTFRTGIDVIQLDVSVLDKDRLPIRGLTAADFTVLEDGKPQRVVAVSEIDAAEKDPFLSAWMRHTPRDVAVNDLGPQLGDGRLFAIVLDDYDIPSEDFNMIMTAREIAHYIVDSLGPSDLAAVVFTDEAGDTQDFTDDRAKLRAAIDRFVPHSPRYRPPVPTGPGPVVGDVMTSSPILARFRCLQNVPAIPTLDTVALRLATVPQRRKTVFFVSVGVPVPVAPGQGCQGVRYDMMRDIFQHAQRGNVNIYAIDPSGTGGWENNFANSGLASIRPGPQRVYQGGATEVLRDFLKVTAENTGARAATSTDDFDAVVDQIFTEDGSYYLVGYQTSNGAPDGRFRRIQVKVNTKGATVRTRSGRWAAREDSAFAIEKNDAPATNDLHLSGLMSPQGLTLRASALPVGLATSTGAGHEAEVALVLTVQVPAPIRPLPDRLTVIRHVYDADGRPGPPVRETTDVVLLPTSEQFQYDVFSRLTLAPGRYQVRFNGSSAAVGKSGTVYADLEVPDFSQASVTLSNIVLGVPPRTDDVRSDPLAGLVPIVPTNTREFAPSDRVAAYVRVYQGGTSPGSASVDVRVLDLHDTAVFSGHEVLPPSAFSDRRGAEHRVDLPVARMTRGPYLLSITATVGARSVRRDVVFRVR